MYLQLVVTTPGRSQPFSLQPSPGLQQSSFRPQCGSFVSEFPSDPGVGSPRTAPPGIHVDSKRSKELCVWVQLQEQKVGRPHAGCRGWSIRGHKCNPTAATFLFPLPWVPLASSASVYSLRVHADHPTTLFTWKQATGNKRGPAARHPPPHSTEHHADLQISCPRNVTLPSSVSGCWCF